MAYIGTSPSNGIRRKYKYTATAGQTSFTGNDDNGIAVSYVDTEYLDVYQNGVKLVAVSDYASTTGTSVVLVQAASADDIIELVVFDVFGVADSVSQSAGGSFAGNIGMGGTLAVTGDVTIGNASATDKKILFDGNAVDFHIGLDDSTDSLTIGKGSALGTTTSMVINANGVITKPLQPAFSAKVASTIDIAAGGAANTTIAFTTEIFDYGSNYASNIFTAPVAGVYQLEFNLRLTGIDTAVDAYDFVILTTNRTYIHRFDPDFADSDFDMMANLAVLADMAAGDTARVQYYQDGGTAQTDIISSSYFQGYLVA